MFWYFFGFVVDMEGGIGWDAVLGLEVTFGSGSERLSGS